MTYTETVIPGVRIIEPEILKNAHGYFMKAFKQTELEGHIGKIQLVQDNGSYSPKGVLQGLHYQLAPYSQSKLARVIKGRVSDVAIDVHEGSSTFGKYVAVGLSDEDKRQLFIPQGFAYGFHVLSDEAVFTYRVNNPYILAHERGIRYDDPTVRVGWSITDLESISLSEEDIKAPLLKDVELSFKC